MTLPLDPRQFLMMASRVAEFRDEASLRTAVGRAYYAAFLVAKEKTGVTRGERIHGLVINAVASRPGFPRPAREMEKLRRLRVAADYRL